MLAQAVESYLAVRRGCGFALKSEGNLLQSFATFSDAKGQPHVCAETAIEWAGLAESVHQRARRLGQVIRFTRYVRAEEPCHELPPAVFGSENRPRPVPYIFSQDNIQRLVHAAAQSGYRTLRRHTYSTLFALLACTGLRVSEAIRLRFEDITPEGLVIDVPNSAKVASYPCTKARKRDLNVISNTAAPMPPSMSTCSFRCAENRCLWRMLRPHSELRRTRLACCADRGGLDPPRTRCATLSL